MIKICKIKKIFTSLILGLFLFLLLSTPTLTQAQTTNPGCGDVQVNTGFSHTIGTLLDNTDPNNTGSTNPDEIKGIICAPQPRIKIPGLSFTSQEDFQSLVDVNADGNTYFNIPFLGQYLAAVYRYAVAAISIIAVVVIIFSGIQWMLPTGSDNVAAAKKRIISAITGLLLAVGSYVILYTINPELVQFKSLRVLYIKGEPIDVDADDRATIGLGPLTRTPIPTEPITLNTTVLDQILQIGGWNETATESAGYEKIPWETVVSIAHENPGLLTLLMGVGRWGIENPPTDLSDPDNRSWNGAGPGSGKHLMDYALGGFGIAHYDSGALTDFYNMYGWPTGVPEQWLSQQDYNYMWCRGHGDSSGRVCSQSNPNGERDTESWQNWMNWARTLLQRRDVQHQLIERWINHYYNDSLRDTGGVVEVALINSRIANSSPGHAESWARLSIDEQLRNYDHTDRNGTMMRPVVVFQYITQHGL